MEQIAAHLQFSPDPINLWNITPTFFLATNAEDSWFASVYDIAQAAHHAWTVFEQMWHGAPVVHAQVGLNGQPTDVRLFGVKDPTVEDVACVVAERYDQSSETLVVVATRCGACTGTVCESTTPLSVLNISQCVRLIPRLEPR